VSFSGRRVQSLLNVWQPVKSYTISLLQKLSASPKPKFEDEAGVTALEYAFIAGLVAIAVVATVSTLGTEVSGLFNSVLNGF
jgi:pilus assembly protein Flp/PilA